MRAISTHNHADHFSNLSNLPLEVCTSGKLHPEIPRGFAVGPSKLPNASKEAMKIAMGPRAGIVGVLIRSPLIKTPSKSRPNMFGVHRLYKNVDVPGQ